jgi:predicted nucleic acid-binding protein
LRERFVLADTGAWLAYFHRRDQYHEPALAAFRSFRERRNELVVTDLILAELHLHLLRGFGPTVAREYLGAVKSDPLVTEFYANADLQNAAMSDWLERFEHQHFSFTDAVSFAVMAANGIKAAFTFDEHFRIAGFEKVPATDG